MISVRVASSAFHPAAAQRVLFVTPAIFSVYRESLDGKELVLCLTNITNAYQDFCATAEQLHYPVQTWVGLLTGETIPGAGGGLRLKLKPYEVRCESDRCRYISPAGTGCSVVFRASTRLRLTYAPDFAILRSDGNFRTAAHHHGIIIHRVRACW